MKQIYMDSGRGVFFSIFLCFVSLIATAQERKITGRITDVAGSGIPGATVVLKGSQMGTNTNAEGDYAINVKSPGDILVVSFVGYKTLEVSVGNQSVVNIKMDDDISSLE